MSLAIESTRSDRKLAIGEKSMQWYCLKAQPKHEHFAAGHLQKMDKFEVFLPRIRFKRTTRERIVWVTEALFPGYLFARFVWDDCFRQVQAARGIRDIVHFGNYWPVIAEATIEEVRKIVGVTGLHTITEELIPGDTVQSAEGSLRGLQGIVSRVMPGRKRVEVLMEILGRQTGVELAVDSLVKEGNERAKLIRR